MFGGSAKRSSDDCAFADATKKKKVSKEKRDSEVLKEKTAVVCNGESRQKKAFFAYFGKSFDESKHGGDNVKKSEPQNETTKKVTTANNDVGERLPRIPLDKNEKKVNADKQAVPRTTKTCFVTKNSTLSYVSSFVEELGCFPKLTHANRSAPLCSSDLMLRLSEETLHDSTIKNSMLSFQTLMSASERLVLEPYQMEINFPYIISSLKKAVPNFPVSDCHKHLKKKHVLAKKSANEVEHMWIDKYKPMCKEEVLGNTEFVKKLKNWLDPNKKNPKTSKKSNQYDDDDDFIFDSDSDSSSKPQHNLIILLGPSGCGKTSAVYAVANEINANVIELNASCNRNGKRIITDLIEATQSHAVEKNSILNMIKGNKKIPKNKKVKKDKNEKMTIILIEDADIFFDNYDDGFLSAISTLATDSKRPLVLTANDPFSNHLLKFAISNEMVLNFIHPSKKHLSCFLQLMALNEGVLMSEDEINDFVHPFKPDIRQSILQLQYVLSTGLVQQKIQNNTYKGSINSVWWNWPFMTECDLTSVENDEHTKSNISIATISQKLDTLSNLNLIHSKTQSQNILDPQPFWHHLAIRDSASLIETNHWSDSSVQLSTDITHWIHNHINTLNYGTAKLYPTSDELSERQRVWNISKNVLEQIGLDYSNRKNETSFDYLATVRSLGQNQQTNQLFLNLRHSKMFSYLKRIDIDIDSKDLKYLCNSLRSSSDCDKPVDISDQF